MQSCLLYTCNSTSDLYGDNFIQLVPHCLVPRMTVNAVVWGWSSVRVTIERLRFMEWLLLYCLCNADLYICVILQTENIGFNTIVMIMSCCTMVTLVISRSSCYHVILQGENLINAIVSCYGVETSAVTRSSWYPCYVSRQKRWF
jgi:hypothetical protein